jgi:hypothetical protein
MQMGINTLILKLDQTPLNLSKIYKFEKKMTYFFCYNSLFFHGYLFNELC